MGALITEVEVNHRPRVHGDSKYGLGRTFRVILDASLGCDLGLLPDRSYYTVLTHPYHYFDVTRADSLPDWPGGLDLSAFGR